jgi:hypothetical protein
MLILVLSMLLGGWSVPGLTSDVTDDGFDVDDAAGQVDIGSHRRHLHRPVVSRQAVASQRVEHDPRARIERMEMEPFADAPTTASPRLSRPVIWTVYRDGRAAVAAGLWPSGRDVARLAVGRIADGEPSAEDVAMTLKMALEHCRQQDYLKLQLRQAGGLAVEPGVIEGQGFIFNRDRSQGDAVISEYYRNIYWREAETDEA